MTRAETRTAILEAARQLAGKKGLDTLATAEVCRAAGVSNGSLFHFFPSKEALAAALYVDALARYQAAIADALRRARSAHAGIRSLTLEHVRFVVAHPTDARLLHEGRRSAVTSTVADEIAALNRNLFNDIRQWLAPHEAKGTVRALPMEVLIPLIFGPIYFVTREWLRDGRDDRLERLGEALADATWEAMRLADNQGRREHGQALVRKDRGRRARGDDKAGRDRAPRRGGDRTPE
jgi:AcrR family transcriptional regulator